MRALRLTLLKAWVQVAPLQGGQLPGLGTLPRCAASQSGGTLTWLPALKLPTWPASGPFCGCT